MPVLRRHFQFGSSWGASKDLRCHISSDTIPATNLWGHTRTIPHFRHMPDGKTYNFLTPYFSFSKLSLSMQITEPRTFEPRTCSKRQKWAHNYRKFTWPNWLNRKSAKVRKAGAIVREAGTWQRQRVPFLSLLCNRTLPQTTQWGPLLPVYSTSWSPWNGMTNIRLVISPLTCIAKLTV